MDSFFIFVPLGLCGFALNFLKSLYYFNLMQIENQIKCKLFAGYVISSELRLQLNQSSLWKQAKIAPSIPHDLEEIHFHQKDYIGHFLTQSCVTLSELKKLEDQISQTLKSYCPHFSSEKIRIIVFSQLFIS